MPDLDALPLILGLGAISLGVSALFALAASDEPSAFNTSVRHRQVAGEELFSRTFDVGRGGRLAVDVVDADVIVDAHDGSGVEVRVMVDAEDSEWGREVFASMSFSAEISGNTVSVHADDDDRYRDGGWDEDRDLSVVAVISVPRVFDAKISTDDGDIDIGALEGDIDIRSSDGDVSAERLSGSNTSIDTSDGDIDIERIDASCGLIRTSDGDVVVGAAGGALEARSSDGDIQVDIEDGAELTVSTADGDITIYAPADFTADVDFRAEDLSIAPDFTLLGQIEGDEVTGALNGGGPPLIARTGDGSIALRVRGG